MNNISTNYRSANFDLRDSHIKFIVIHYTEMNFEDAILRLNDENSKVSAHYIIEASGAIHNLVEEPMRAWHAGLSSWSQYDKLNDHSIGIELDNLGNKVFEEAQIESCIKLCKFLCEKYEIPKPNIIGHSDIAFERKIDPGIFFPWKRLAKEGLGLFPKHYIKNDKILAKFGEQKEIIREIKKKLKILGYKISNLNNAFDLEFNYVSRAFLSKFYPEIIFKQGGVEFYNNSSSKYFWDLSAYDLLKKMVELVIMVGDDRFELPTSSV